MMAWGWCGAAQGDGRQRNYAAPSAKENKEQAPFSRGSGEAVHATMPDDGASGAHLLQPPWDRKLDRSLVRAHHQEPLATSTSTKPHQTANNNIFISERPLPTATDYRHCCLAPAGGEQEAEQLEPRPDHEGLPLAPATRTIRCCSRGEHDEGWLV